jgi:hypothetical protein
MVLLQLLLVNTAADSYGFVAPFLVALLPLFSVALLVLCSWTENYGNQKQNYLSLLLQGFHLIRSDSRIAALGFGQSCLEGAMYTFVFMLTPALKTVQETNTEANGEIMINSTATLLGLIFAVFMICVMVGSSIFAIFGSKRENLYKIPLFMHFAAFISMLSATISLENKFIVYLSFLLFETTVGIFYPAYGVIKSEKIPEEIRSSVINIFRIPLNAFPLNAFVVLLLLKIKYLSSTVVFSICTCAHACAFLCYLYFYLQSRISFAKEDEKDMVNLL